MDIELDRIADRLRTSGRLAFPLDGLGGAPGLPLSKAAGLTDRLAADPRFLLVESDEPEWQEAYAWPAEQRAAYAPVLRAAGVAGLRAGQVLVVLRDAGDAPSTDEAPADDGAPAPAVAALLRRSTRRLLERDPSPTLLAAAERAATMVAAVSHPQGGAAPSTTPVPDPPVPHGALRPPRL